MQSLCYKNGSNRQHEGRESIDCSKDGIEWGDGPWDAETRTILSEFKRNTVFEKWWLAYAHNQELRRFTVGQKERDVFEHQQENRVPYLLSLPFPTFAYNSDYGVAKYIVLAKDVDALNEAMKKETPPQLDLEKYDAMHVCDLAFCFSASYE